jgi:ketosteroid isomerase-like protein
MAPVSSFNEEQALVAEANTGFYRAFEALDMDLMRSVWLQADDIKCVHPAWERMSGWEAVMHSWELIMANTARIRFGLEEVEVVVNGGIGFVSCLEHIYDGEELVGVAVATNLFQQNAEGRWLMLHHHASPFTRRLPA